MKNIDKDIAFPTKQLFYRICKLFYILGSPNYWFEEIEFSPNICKILDANYYISNILVCVLIASQWSAFCTPNNFNEKQNLDLFMFSLGNSLYFFNTIVFNLNKENLRAILFELIVKFKNTYNNLNVEEMTIKKAKSYAMLFGLSTGFTFIIYNVDALYKVISTDASFAILITVWPDMEDKSHLADVGRAVTYIIYCMFIFRFSASFCIVIFTTICLSHQFKNLCKYFEGLNDIFETDASQEEKERKYEEGLKIGIKLHAETLSCTEKHQYVCNAIFGGTILFSLTGIAIMLSQMVHSDRSLTPIISAAASIIVVLIATGLHMWSAGDVTVEASHMSTAMFCSGWHNCRKSSARVRTLLTIAMTMSQKPVILKSFNIINISYNSYVTIVKSSYSLFSVLY